MNLKKWLPTLLTSLILSNLTIAQDVTFTLTEVTEFKIAGDSNLRTWDADITDIEAELVLTGTDELSLENLTAENIESINIAIAVAGIDTDTARLTTNLRNYLKGSDFPHITFSLNDVHSIDYQTDKAVITADGTITAAGVEKAVTLSVDSYVNANGSIRFKGVKDMLMTDFEIDPPTALLGTVRADNEIQILFDVTFAAH